MFAEARLRTGTGWADYTILRKYKDLSFDTKYNDIPAINITIPTADATALGIGDQSVIEIAPNGASIYDGWYYIDGTSGTSISDDELWTTFSGKGIVGWLADAVVYPSAWPSATPEGHSFQNVTPGTILATLIARAVARGTLLWLDASTFTGTTTSNSTGWSTTGLSITYSNGTSVLAVLQDLANRGILSWRMSGMQLQVFNYDEMVTHRTPEQATFRRGWNILEQSANTSSENWVSAVLVVGDQNQAVERTDAGAQAAIGRRREALVSQSGITDGPTLQLLGDKYLALGGHKKSEETVGASDALAPWTAYQVGDWVWEDKDGTLTNLQIRQIAAGAQDESTLKVGLTLGDFLDEQDAKIAKLINAITGGGDVQGGLPSAATNDGMAPAAPTGVTVTPTAYRDSNGHDFDQITVGWTAPTTNSDGSPLTDLQHYDVEYSLTGTWSASTTVQAGTVVAYFSGFQAGGTITFRVRAVDSAGNASAWANSSATALPGVTTTPATPSTPTAAGILKGLVVGWDGKDNAAAAYDSSWQRTDIHVSSTTGFTPGAATLVGSFITRGGSMTISNLAYATTYYVKLIAIDKSGNSSAASTQSSGTTAAQLSDPDLPAKLVTGAKIADTTITTAQLTVAAFGDSVAANGSFEDVATAATDTTGCAGWKTAYYNGTPTSSRDTTTFATGTAALKISIPTGNPEALSVTNSAIIAVSTGDIWYIRFKAKASRAGVVSIGAQFSLSYDAAHSLALFDPNNPWEAFVGENLPAGNTGALTADWQTFEGQLIVPVGALNPLVIGRPIFGTTQPSDNTAVDVWIDDVQLAPVRGTAYIADASIVNAKINDVSADKITVGTLVADITVSSRIKTADTGARVEVNSTGIQAFDTGGNQTIGIQGNDGSVNITGTLQASAIADTSIGDSQLINSIITGTDCIIDNSGGRVLVYALSGQTVTTITTTGAGTWTVPVGVTSVKVELWGAGGGGQGSHTDAGVGAGGSGGSGGEYACNNNYAVTPTDVINYQVGVGGAGNNGTNAPTAPPGAAGAGGATSFDDGAIVANGGNGGWGGFVINGGSGSTAPIHFSGGRNGLGNYGQAGGGGGGSGGSSRNGNGGTSVAYGATVGGAGGAAVTNGAAGGAGGSQNANGNAGGAPGGGGGGAGCQISTRTPRNGAAGGRGQIRLTYGGAYVLVASIAGVAGTDQYGNAYPAGVWVDANILNPTHLVGTTGEPAFQNNWVAYASGGFGNPGFYKDAAGIVHVVGLTKSGTIGANTICFTLPTGYRPAARRAFAIVSNNLFGRCDVDGSGNVITAVGSNVWFSFDGVHFKAEG